VSGGLSRCDFAQVGGCADHMICYANYFITESPLSPPLRRRGAQTSVCEESRFSCRRRRTAGCSCSRIDISPTLPATAMNRPWLVGNHGTGTGEERRRMMNRIILGETVARDDYRLINLFVGVASNFDAHFIVSTPLRMN
jgi:hypothetical protein